MLFIKYSKRDESISDQRKPVKIAGFDMVSIYITKYYLGWNFDQN
jgi:hypothetical protein